MNYYDIEHYVLKVFTECEVTSFPIDCQALLHHYGYSVYSYQELSEKNKTLYEMCSAFSEDAFRDGKNMIIAYNEKKPAVRIRFSLAHELGHHILNHSGISKRNETEANYFAGHLLSPRIIIHYSGCESARDVSLAFHISMEAAQIAWDNYCRWHKRFNGYISNVDYQIYTHFCTGKNKKFIWNIKKCEFCGATLYNSLSNHCRYCSLPKEIDRDSHSTHTFGLFLSEEDKLALRRLENRYLSLP